MGDVYPNDSGQVCPYQTIFLFQECKSSFDHKPFHSCSNSPLKLNKYILYIGITEATFFFPLFLNKLIIYLPKFKFGFTSDSFHNTVLSTCASLFIYWFRNQFLLPVFIFRFQSCTVISFAQSKCGMHQHTTKIESQEPVTKNSWKSTTVPGSECK